MRATDLTISPLLIVVHPGSACGSADFNIGRDEAGGYRDLMVHDLRNWRGNVLVVDGNLSDELTRYPSLNSALEGCVAANKGERIFACAEETPGWVAKVSKSIAHLPRETAIRFTGAWFHTQDNHGCINAVYSAAQSLGFMKLDILDSAVRIDAGDEDEDYEE